MHNLRKHFERKSMLPWAPSKTVRAVNGVSLRLSRGETLGIVGESGCGKSTLARLLLGLDEPTTGEIFIAGVAQMVFQDPYSSFNPKMSVFNIIEEPLVVTRRGDRAERAEKVRALIKQVGLEESYLDRYPSQLSGGQRQRVGVARALALNPSVVVADEPTSALDVSVRAQIINLLCDLKDELGISFVFISHDLLTVRYISDRIAVMYLGEVVEYGPAEEVFTRPAHPYTRALLDAIPVPDPAIEAKRAINIISGELPSPLNIPAGLRFRFALPEGDGPLPRRETGSGRLFTQARCGLPFCGIGLARVLHAALGACHGRCFRHGSSGEPATDVARGVQHSILDRPMHRLEIDVRVNSRDVDGGDDAACAIAHGDANRAHAAFEEGLADAIAAGAVGRENLLQFRKGRGRLRRGLRQLAFGKERAQVRIVEVDEQHSAHDRSVRGKARADLHAAGDRRERRDARDVDDLAPVPHGEMRRQTRAVAQLLQRRQSDLGQIERSQIGEAAIEQARAQPERTFIGAAQQVAGALERHQQAKHACARQSQRLADLGRGQRRTLAREQREHVEAMGQGGNHIALARVARMCAVDGLRHSSSRILPQWPRTPRAAPRSRHGRRPRARSLALPDVRRPREG